MPRILYFLFFALLITTFHTKSLQAQYPDDPFQFPDTLGRWVTPGVLWGDFNEDGYDDIYFSHGAQGASALQWQNELYENNGDGTFTKITEAGTIVTDEETSGGGAWGDYDNDGDLDMLIAQPFTYGSFPTNHSQVNLYANNNGDGTFSDASAGDLVADETSRSKAVAVWADYNNDGWLDAFVSNATFFGTKSQHALYVNNQDGTFTEESNNLTAGESVRGGVSWLDFDRDGDMDIAIASGSVGQSTVLWIDEGDDYYGDTLIAGDQSGNGKDTQGLSWGDYDNDGDFDLFLSNYGDNTDEPETNILFRFDSLDANGHPVFTKDSLAGDIVTDEDLSMGSAWGDYDNDGDLDIFVGSDGAYSAGNSSRLYENNGDGTFSKKTNTIAADSATFARGLAWSDYDNDGDLDLLVGRDGKNRLFTNNGNSNNWLEIDLVGVNANISAIGAIVRVKATIDGQEVWQMRDVNAQTGYGSHNSLRLHFGLGDATVVDSLIIDWPGSGQQNIYEDVGVNSIVSFTENEPSAISDQDLKAPSSFRLFQNYPNPFNPNTTIRYALLQATNVNISIYNTLGQKIQTLVNRKQNAGVHQVKFNGEHLASGVYYYRIDAGSFSDIRKMVILK
ncbi:MAG: T9SS type A sorting domain-containing protein [Caldithrix sp.]|nr:T9SS type A sorting domain-containing protein [Caldithrix sp.]